MTKTIAIEVMKAVIVVELWEREGMLYSPLLIIMKKSLAKKAKKAPTMKCQSKIIWMMRKKPISPAMRLLDPVRIMEITVTNENKMV